MTDYTFDGDQAGSVRLTAHDEAASPFSADGRCPRLRFGIDLQVDLERDADSLPTSPSDSPELNTKPDGIPIMKPFIAVFDPAPVPDVD